MARILNATTAMTRKLSAQHHLLNLAISDLEAGYAVLTELYKSLHPDIIGHTWISTRYRMACQMAFEEAESELRSPFGGLIKLLRNNSQLVKAALESRATGIAESGFQLADWNLRQAEAYFRGLEESVLAHVQIQTTLIAHGSVGSKD